MINPELLAYAVLEPGSAEPRLRLGFSTRVADPDGELELTGEAAREVLRWLRLNATFLSTNGGFGSTGQSVQAARRPSPGAMDGEHTERSAKPSGPRNIPSRKKWDDSSAEQENRADRLLAIVL